MYPSLSVRNINTFEAPMCLLLILSFCFPSLHRGNHYLTFRFIIPILYFIVIITHVGVCWHLCQYYFYYLWQRSHQHLNVGCFTIRTHEIQVVVVLMTEIYYSHIVRIHSQSSKGKGASGRVGRNPSQSSCVPHRGHIECTHCLQKLMQ